MKGSICAVLAATAVAVSCKKQETVNPVLVTSTVEVMLGEPATKAFGDNKAENWEKDVYNVAMFVYESGQDVCAYQRQFTEYEVKKGKAVFAIPNVKENTSYDFYAIANCDFTAEMASYAANKQGVARSVLEGTNYQEGMISGSVSRFGNLVEYNGSFSVISKEAKRNYQQNNKGFAMSGKESATTPAKIDNVPTRVTVPLKRTVAKVMIKSSITPDFIKKYPGTGFRIINAEIDSLAQQTFLMKPKAISSIALRNDALKQVPDSVKASETGTFTLFRNLFYIYENGIAGTAVAKTEYKPILFLTAEFDFDGNWETKEDKSTITYEIPLAGEAGSIDNTKDANFGLFVRNGSYLVDVAINGLSSNEVVAEIKVEEWEPLKTQNVEIGNRN